MKESLAATTEYRVLGDDRYSLILFMGIHLTTLTLNHDGIEFEQSLLRIQSNFM